MTKNISRLLTQTKKHYSGARLQQGRILLDSDANEGAKLAEGDRRWTLVDALGPKGSPDQGFSLCRWPADVSNGSDVLKVGDVLTTMQPNPYGGSTTAPNILPLAVRPGSMYVGGLRFDLEDTEPLAYQRDFLQMGTDDAPAVKSGASFRHFYYLEAWEQIVTSVEDQEL